MKTLQILTYIHRNIVVPIHRSLLLIALLTIGGIPVHAEVKPNGLFSDSVVLQEGRPVPVWGAANDGEKVTVTFQNQTVTTTAKDGRWILYLKPLKAGGPFVMTIAGDNTITLTNVLIGEVWLCSGQSNMEMPLAATTNASEAIAAARDPQLRFFTVPFGASNEPKTQISGSWKEAAQKPHNIFPRSLISSDAIYARHSRCR
jgi:sialate O-acetylesterase